MSAIHCTALVLNASYEPLCVVSGRRAVVLCLTDKAIPVACADQVLHSERAEVAVPVVVRLTRFVRVPFRATVPLTRKAVFARDGGRCVYCGGAATSLDHVVPKSRGGSHTWDNVVSACGRCNHIKADRGIAELGWRLHAVPAVPSGSAWRVVGARRVDPRWRPWLDLPEAWEEPA
ncbi:MAG TPA: HNH endonuclease [Mycobacteriales bacterium]|nr:HNH endonuclease [Mycobacteriales bacterium]